MAGLVVPSYERIGCCPDGMARSMQCAVKYVKGVEVELGQNYHNLEWELPVAATRRCTWAVAIVAATNMSLYLAFCLPRF